MNIDILDEENRLTNEDVDLVEKILQYTATNENISSEAELSISIVDDEAIWQLNKAYRNKDRPTDVLSFPMDEEPLMEGMPVMLGDIIISYDKIVEQADNFNHSFARELCFLTVHGLLHLIGYTHDNEAEEKEMFAKQRNILEEFGLER